MPLLGEFNPGSLAIFPNQPVGRMARSEIRGVDLMCSQIPLHSIQATVGKRSIADEHREELSRQGEFRKKTFHKGWRVLAL